MLHKEGFEVNKVISAIEAANLINDNDAVATSASSGLAGLPEEILVAIGNRFKKEGHPKNITFIHSSGIGNNSEGRGADHLAHEGLVKRIISGHPGFSHKMARFIAESKVEAYLLPQGVMAQLWRATAGKRPGLITKVGLNTYVDPRVQGAKANDITKENIIDVVELNGEEWLQYHNFPIDVAIIRATTADTKGNLTTEKEIAHFEILPVAMAAKNNGGIVVAQVERIAEENSLDPKLVRVPAALVDYIVVGSETYHQQTMRTSYDPALSGELRVPLDSIEPMELSPRKIIARRAAMELEPNSIVNLGIGMPDGVSGIAVEEGVSDELTLTVEFGIFGGSPALGLDFGSSYNAQAYIDHASMFDFYDGGGLDATFLGMAQLDRYGNVNVSQLGSKVIGPGGFINISQSSKKVVFMGTFTLDAEIEIENNALNIVKEGTVPKVVKEVDQITFSGKFANDNQLPVLFVTERAVFDIKDNHLRLIEVAPGIDIERDILSLLEFKPLIAEEIKLMDETIFQESWGRLKEIMDAKRG